MGQIKKGHGEAGVALLNLGGTIGEGLLACVAQFTKKRAIFGGRPMGSPRFFRSEDGQMGM
jgi:hypothetical protein